MVENKKGALEFDVPEYKFDYVNKQFENFAKHDETEPQEFIVNLI